MATKTVRLDKDWEYIKTVTVNSIDVIKCPICLSEDAEIAVPKILRCHHIFCFACVVRQVLDLNQECAICKKQICLRELKTVSINRIQLQKGQEAEFKLMQKANATRFVLDAESKKQVSYSHPISFASYEDAMMNEVKFLRENFQALDLSQLVFEVCEFINFWEIQNFNNCPKEFDKHDRRPGHGTSSTTAKEEKYTYFYQFADDHPAFLHPFEFELL